MKPSVAGAPPWRMLLRVLCTLPWLAPPAHAAAPGTLVKNQPLQFTCSSSVGVGIAFDGQNLWASCANGAPDLYKAGAATPSRAATSSSRSATRASSPPPSRRGRSCTS